MNRIKMLFFPIFFVMFYFSAYAAEKVAEHPMIRPFPGSVLAENMSKHKNFDAYEFYYLNETTKKREKKAVKGEYWRLLYEVRTSSGDRVRTISKLEFFENYRAAAEEKGGRVVYEDVSQMVITIPRDDGGVTWLMVSGSANLGQQDLIIIDEEPFKKLLTFGPAEMKAALDAEGRVQLNDILFDLDKATLQPESTKQLQDVVTLLKENPDLKLEVQGHTDNQGDEDYNLKLSQRRAETVVAYLGLFGIDSARLTPKGFGESTPVVSNDTEEGRAKNRRVELVKQ
ncbi:MAG: OmpA family protein [Deltaproteobacteria bacterium]|nr:OmpA family protein [Deltaproteobacteria bacterium]